VLVGKLVKIRISTRAQKTGIKPGIPLFSIQNVASPHNKATTIPFMFDKLLVLIILLLLVTVGAWLKGWFVYPFGILVLLMALIIRSIQVFSNRQ
jgi:hypothetical protein